LPRDVQWAARSAVRANESGAGIAEGGRGKGEGGNAEEIGGCGGYTLGQRKPRVAWILAAPPGCPARAARAAAAAAAAIVAPPGLRMRTSTPLHRCYTAHAGLRQAVGRPRGGGCWGCRHPWRGGAGGSGWGTRGALHAGAA